MPLPSTAQTTPHNRPPVLSVQRVRFASNPQQLRETIRYIGRAIRDGSQYLPIRNHSAGLASRAPAKDYPGQVAQIYDDFTRRRWRYVKDPVETELLAGTGKAIWSQIFGADARPGERGVGDCDEATEALGAALYSIGMPVRIATIAKPRSRGLFQHVFPQAYIPRLGWVSVDAVGYPTRALGWTPPHSRIALWNLDGNLGLARGRFPRQFREMFYGDVAGAGRDFGADDESGRESGGIGMNYDQEFPDYGLERYGFAGTDNAEPVDWADEGLLGFGAYQYYGLIDGSRSMLMEYDEDDEIETATGPLVRTKMLEMSPTDIDYVRQYGCPRPQSVALADDGEVYQWVPGTVDGGLGRGFFRKIFRRVKKRVRKGVRRMARRLKRRAKALIKKLPGGKYLLKLHKKLHKVAMKLVRPLTKFVGKYAKKLAPIAALIPGYGPAIAGALYTAGGIASLLRKHGIKTDKKGRPKFKSGKQAKMFKKALRSAAAKQKAKGVSGYGADDDELYEYVEMLGAYPKLALLPPRQRKAMIRKIRARKRVRRRLPRAFRRDSRLLRRGTPEHRAVLRGLGADLPDDETMW